MSWTVWAAVVVVCVTVWALIKRYETRLVLLVSGGDAPRTLNVCTPVSMISPV